LYTSFLLDISNFTVMSSRRLQVPENFTVMEYLIINKNLRERNSKYFHSIWFFLVLIFVFNRIGGVIVTVLASSAVDREFDPRSGQAKDYKLVFVVSALSTQH
jgi:hypothetical protein